MDDLISYVFWNNKGGVGKTTLAFQLSTAYAQDHPEENILCLDVCPQTNFSASLLNFLRSGAAANNGILDEGSAKVQELETEPVDIRNSEGNLMMCVPRNIAGLFKLGLNHVEHFPGLTVRVADYNPNLSENMHLLCGSSSLDLFSSRLAFESGTDWDFIHSLLRNFVQQWHRSHGGKKTTVFIDTNPALTAYTQVALCAADRLLVPVNADDYSKQAFENLIHLIYPQPDNPGGSLLGEFRGQSFGQRLRNSRLLNTPKIHCIIHNRGALYAGRPAAVFESKVDQLWEIAYRYFASSGGDIFTSLDNVPQRVAAEIRRLQIDDNAGEYDKKIWMKQYTADRKSVV